MLMAELDTAVRCQLPITVVVNNNASLSQIEWEQVVVGYPDRPRASPRVRPSGDKELQLGDASPPQESARPGSSVMNLCGIMPRIWVKMTRS
jgi:hypothetical protein